MNSLVIAKVHTVEYDEVYTPYWAVTPIIKYLKPKARILCPFDTELSQYVKALKDYGFDVIYTHKDYVDFFEITPVFIKHHEIDYIISNPPYSIKDQVLEHAYKLNIPFAFLMPITTLEGVERGKMFLQHGIQVLVFDKRINFIGQGKTNYFNTSYFCWNVLPKDLIFETLIKGE